MLRSSRGDAMNERFTEPHAVPPSTSVARRIYLDFTHLGRHVTGIERVTIEQFQKISFPGADVRPVRARGILSMILRQQFLIPLLAILNPSARFVFPGFPPSPLMRLFARSRTILYVHDLFLLNRRQDLGLKARLYMAVPFGIAVRGLKHFMTNSEKTRRELELVAPSDARIALYRPKVDNVFDLADRSQREPADPEELRIVALGTVEPRKNYLAAAAIVDAIAARGHPSARVDIIGREGWGNETERLRAHPRVQLRGFLTSADAKAAIESADVYLCTSHDEGLGLPLIEVQFAGLQVAAPDAPVFREVLGASGLYIDPAKPDEAADIILAAMTDPHWRANAARAAAANVARWNAAAELDAARIAALLVADWEAAQPNGAARTAGT